MCTGLLGFKTSPVSNTRSNSSSHTDFPASSTLTSSTSLHDITAAMASPQPETRPAGASQPAAPQAEALQAEEQNEPLV